MNSNQNNYNKKEILNHIETLLDQQQKRIHNLETNDPKIDIAQKRK